MLTFLFLIVNFVIVLTQETTEVQYLNELPLDKLVQLKESLKEFVPQYDNTTSISPAYLENFGAQAMAIQAPPIRRGDYESKIKKGGFSKISNIFSMSVTTLAFLAFGGYLLCLIVHAVKAKHGNMVIATTQPTFLLNSNIKRPQTQFASYGRKKRDIREPNEIDLPPDEMFSALIQLCEGYAKWSRQ